MNTLDLSAINITAPYSVWSVNDYYYFKTDCGAIYKVGFMEDDTIWKSGAYQFLIINENNLPSPRDNKPDALPVHIENSRQLELFKKLTLSRTRV